MGETKDGSRMGRDMKRDRSVMEREAVWVITSVGLHMDVSSLWVRSADDAYRQWEMRT